MGGGDDFINSSSNQQIFNEKGQKKGVSQLYFIALGVGIVSGASSTGTNQIIKQLFKKGSTSDEQI